MCGICGIYNFKSREPVEHGRLARMNDSLTHRGPDEAGLHLDGAVGIAMRRLSIIDLVTGSQPIWNEDHTVAVVYNGEMYNYKPIGRELEARGHVFRTRSDTETIVHAYEEFGADCLSHLRGMFAFAIWDSRQQTLLLARDRLGIKPLFYALTDAGILFGSEIKSLLAAGLPRVLDPVALDQYLSHFCVPTPWSIFRDIRRLEPGHALIVANETVRDLEYWDLAYTPEPFRGDERSYIEQTRALLRESVARHLQADVPLGAFLSGGLDSATVVAEMSALVNEPVHTFTVGFREASYDERPQARLVAEHFHTHHTDGTIDLDWRDLLPRLMRCFDEPYGDYAAIAGYFVSELARRQVKVVLSGDGGDELFAGYPTHYAFRVARLYRRVPALVRRGLIAPLAQRLPTSMDRLTLDYMAKRFVVGAEMPFQQGHFLWKAIFREDQKADLFTPEFLAQRNGAGDGYAVFERYFNRVAHLDPLSQLLYVDAKTFLLDDNLTRVDRASMAHSLEVRVPLLDDELIEFLRRVPTQVKQPGWRTKHLMRQAMRGVLPDPIVRGRKRGFTPPMPYWLQNELKPILLELLAPQKLKPIGVFNPAHVQTLIAEHLQGRRDNNRQLWALMAFVLWWDAYAPSHG